MKILANDGIDAAGKALLESAGHTVQTESIPQQDLNNRLNDFDVIVVRSATQVRKELIDAAPNIKIIARGGVGMDNIDVEYAKSRGIHVVNTPAASSNSVAELVFGHLLSALRFLNYTNRIMPNEGDSKFKELKKECAKGKELFGKTLGLIGMGRIGQETARIALGLGMNVVAHDAFVEEVSIKIKLHPALGMEGPSVSLKSQPLEAVLSEADFITLHIPGGSGNLIGEKELAQMKKGAGIVNCARGGVVDEKALKAALESGHLSFAALDVFESEPPVYTDILSLRNVSLSPHIGASTVEAQERIGIELAEKINSLLN
ncbi:MAG: 3-phosphoglycerate dehydrogenase [Bacteroidetes bacterium]|nr:3-phosphoglycerate dehydrogenase [Bacteroidota bacterium]